MSVDIEQLGNLSPELPKRSITTATALRLARLFGSSAQFWMALQTRYDPATMEHQRGQAIRAEAPVLAPV